jgi:predicted MPP superfamily phosphohydrolase
MPSSFSSLVANVADYAFRSLLVVAAVGAACIAYGVFVERRWYRLAVYRLPILPSHARLPLTVLHLSDLHFVGSDRGKARFLASLPRPDITVLTGDLLGEPAAVETVTAALGPVRGTAGSYFVLGSNDYFVPRPLSYLAYFRKRRRPRSRGTPGRSRDLSSQLEADGWTHLKNRRVLDEAPGLRLDVVGLDDPHIERHDLRVAVGRDPEAFGLALVHSPDPAPELAALGYDLVVCGHTHGGQVRMPFLGALVTNSTIPTGLCMGLVRFGRTLMHVSPGLGTSKFAPFRFLCRPEATLLELTPARRGSNESLAQDPGTTAEASTRSNTSS